MAGVATLLCGMFGLGVMALSSAPSGAATSATLFVDNVAGTQTTGCSTSGAGACKTIQQGVTAAEALSSTNVTLDVAGSSTTYTQAVTINLPSSGGDTRIEGTGSTLPTLDDGGAGSNITIPDTSAGAVTIDHMTISGGNASTGAESGGAIFSIGTGTVTVGNTFSGNTIGQTAAEIDVADNCHGGTSGDLVVLAPRSSTTPAPAPTAAPSARRVLMAQARRPWATAPSRATACFTAAQSAAFRVGNGTVTNSTFVSNTNIRQRGGVRLQTGTR